LFFLGARPLCCSWFKEVTP